MSKKKAKSNNPLAVALSELVMLDSDPFYLSEGLAFSIEKRLVDLGYKIVQVEELVA